MSKSQSVLERSGLEQLLQALKAGGYLTVGPTVQEQAMVYAELHTLEDLPNGLRDRQERGDYKLAPRSDAALFG